MKLLIIFNPQASHRKAGKLFQKIKLTFETRGVQAHFMPTEFPWHGMDLVEHADLSSYDGVIAAGGDGTIFEVINGYYRNKGSVKPPLGVLPIGTGNSFARDLDLLGFEWEKAMELILSGKTRKVDVARFTTEDKTYYYLNILGLGFVADVNATAQHLKIFGNSAYSIGVFYRLIRMNTYHLDIELDGKKLARENFFVEVSNTRYTGATFLMAPAAKIDDGLLDITLVNKTTRRRILKIFPKIFDGTHISAEEVETFTARKIKIQTNIPKTLTPDGEQMGSTPLEIECLPGDIEVFCG